MATLLDTTTPSRQRTLVVRFAGDSGDGIQLAGHEFARTTADAGADFMTFPDYPAEIRAPAGTTFGVSAFQIQFGPGEVLTPGDEADVLVAFNPAALKTNLQYLKPGGLLIADDTHFDARGLKKAGIEKSPLEDGSLAGYRLVTVSITRRALEALAALDLGRKHASRARNFWALGLVYWLFGRDMGLTAGLLERKFANDDEVRNANLLALKAGHAYGETAELSEHEEMARVSEAAGTGKGRIISGTQAMALGIAAIPVLSQREVIYCSYPITPA
ncbi:MAG: 2-oxoacid:acceptor oxidoreductase family protein, partial [Hyphomicrobiales bacterium]